MNVSDQMRALALRLDQWETQAYDPYAGHCRRLLPGQEEPIVLTLQEYSAEEAGRSANFLNKQLTRAGTLLSRAFAAGLFSDVEFIEMHSLWRSYQRADEANPSPMWWSKFLHQFIGEVFALQVAGELTVCSFKRPHWECPPPSHARTIDEESADLREWWHDALAELANLIDNLVAAKRDELIVATPDQLLPLLQMLVRESNQFESPEPRLQSTTPLESNRIA